MKDLSSKYGKGCQKESLRICLLTYRGNPNCGGQGVYIAGLARALQDLGHEVEVVAGPPYPQIHASVILHKLPGLDLYNPDHLFQVKDKKALYSPLNQFEFLSMCTGGFPEPFTFGVRAYRFLRHRLKNYDVVHDNQSLSYGLIKIKGSGYPIVATIHHPITVDRDAELDAASSWLERLRIRRWYSFLAMQKRVARLLPHLITVSEHSRSDISRAFNIPDDRFHIVPNGIDFEIFRPMKGIKRRDDQILAINSADTPLKGLRYLIEAVASICRQRDVHLRVIGQPKEDGPIVRQIRQLNLQDRVFFTGRIETSEFARYYGEATMVVVPSIYEGFGLPAAEAMACGVPVIATTGGALPEVVGDAGVLVPPADVDALRQAILDLLSHPDKRHRLGDAGLKRVRNNLTWEKAAIKTLDVYREAINAYRRI